MSLLSGIQKEAHREANRRYVTRNVEKVRERNRLRKRRDYEDPIRKLVLRIRVRVYRALRWSKTRVFKSNSTMGLVGITKDGLLKHIESQFLPGMNWENMGDWHLDHIKPCASFDLSDPEQQKLCFHYTNLQPLWASDNLSKGPKLSMERTLRQKYSVQSVA